MRGITIGVLIAAGIAGLWAAQRAKATSSGSTLGLADQQSKQAGVTTPTIPNVTARVAPPSQDSIDPKMVITPKADIDPKMVITPKADIDPKMVKNPPPPRLSADKNGSQPRTEV